MSSVASVRRELAELRREAPALAESSLAAAALALARKLDDRESSAAAAASCARELRETMEALRRLVPKPEAGDGIDELQARAARKLAAVPPTPRRRTRKAS